MKKHKALYCAFDLFPTSKGASTHINYFAKALFEYYNGGLLFTLGSPAYLEEEWEGNVQIKRFQKQVPNFWDRTRQFARSLKEEIERNDELELIHFRDIWSAQGILSNHQNYQTVFEVNSLPSIELPYRYSSLSNKTIEVIQNIELDCLEKCDQIVVPSELIRDRIINFYGINENKISVIPNGAEICTVSYGREIKEDYIIYFGAVQKWQGVDDLIKSMPYLLKMKPDLKLVICSSTRPREAKLLHKLINRLELSENIEWFYQLEKDRLSALLQHALISVAPLKESERNIVQGCSPLKILESLAHKVPVIASDLQVTREIINNDVDGIFVQPERPNELGRTIYLLLSDDEKRKSISREGLIKLQKEYTWEIQTNKLNKLYEELRQENYYA